MTAAVRNGYCRCKYRRYTINVSWLLTAVAVLSWPDLRQSLTVPVACLWSLRRCLVDRWQLCYLATPETRTPAFNIPIAPDRSCLDTHGMNNKAIKLKLLCFYTWILTSYKWNDKIFCFIYSRGRHVQNIVNQWCGGSQCLYKHRYWV